MPKMRPIRVFAVCFVAILALGALAAASASAEPHVYKSGVIVPEGEKIPILTWGTLTLTPEPAEAGAPTSCENAAGGFGENPIGGGATVGQTQEFTSWNCTNAACPPGEQVGLGQREFVVDAEQLPWSIKLIEEAGGIRTEATGVRVSLGCAIHGKYNGTPNEKSAPGFVGG